MDARQAGPSPTLGRRLLLAGCACAALGGCAGFWDDVTSRDFHFKDAFKKAPEPMSVIRTSNDGVKKSKALRALKEPLQNGGTQAQQDEAMQALTWSATSDPQPLCRMAAIDALQHFKDPRAAQTLMDAWERASYFQRDRPETMATIRCQALAALGVNSNPATVDLLVRILKEPPQAGLERDKQDTLDERIAAARALAHYPQYQAAEALVAVLRTEHDVALRNRATESLQEITGKDLPPDAQAWADYLHTSASKGEALAGKRSLTDKVIKLMSFSP